MVESFREVSSAVLAFSGLALGVGDFNSCGEAFSGVLVSDDFNTVLVFSDPNLDSLEERDFAGSGDAVRSFLFCGENGVCFSVSSKALSLENKTLINRIGSIQITFPAPFQETFS